MAEGTRPSRLNLFAVLNFVIAGVLAIVSMGWIIGIADAYIKEGHLARFIVEDAGFSNGSPVLAFAVPACEIVSCALLICSGIGYLRKKRVLGRAMGSLYGIVALVGMGLKLYGGYSFEGNVIIASIYPAATLLLVNTTFKEDLVN